MLVDAGTFAYLPCSTSWIPDDDRCPDDMPYPDTVLHLGNVFRAVGIGRYPYDCISRDKHPNAMIYHSDGAWLLLHKD